MVIVQHDFVRSRNIWPAVTTRDIDMAAIMDPSRDQGLNQATLNTGVIGHSFLYWDSKGKIDYQGDSASNQ